MTGRDAPPDRTRRPGIEELLPPQVAEALDLLAGESTTSRSFVGGLVLGALVGAAIAGSSALRHRALWRGWRLPKR